MVDFFKDVDLQRLAGVKDVLGIDIMEDAVSVVELQRCGNPLKKSSSRFSVMQSFMFEWEEAQTVEERAKKLQNVLQLRSPKAQWAVANVASRAVRSLVVEVPSEVENIHEWIIEHHEKLLKIPISLDQVTIGLEVLKESGTGALVEVTFVRNSEIDETTLLFQKAGIELLAIGASSRDAVNAVMKSVQKGREQEIQFYYVEDQRTTRTTLINGKRMEVVQASLEAICEHETNDDQNKLMIASGRLAADMTRKRVTLFRPWNLPAEYCLAAGLAIKGLLPEISPVNFLKASSRERVAERISRRLFQRVALVLGSVVMILLLGHMFTGYYLEHRLQKIEDQILSSGSAYTEVELLKHQVTSLESRLQGKETSLRRTRTAKILHDIAGNTPDSLWFSHLKLTEEGPQRATVSLSGYARSPEYVTAFLKMLKHSGLCSSVTLVRSGVLQNSESVMLVHTNHTAFTMFEITADLSANFLAERQE
ncbi:MAG: PilN domain-containing protein [Ignavibacteria bacterium]|nr:PilN domain-containing protein [Ignavibacteria bacterium]MBI3766167.1 PilN domain-containing protein [Ignavibacteriales bacterium]